MKNLLSVLAIVAALVALPLPAADSTPRSITTTGSVEVMLLADSAQLDISLEVLEPTLEQSNSRLDATLATLQAELKTRGISARSVVLKRRNVHKRWDYSNHTSQRKFLGYRATVSVSVSIDDISKLSPLITHLGLLEECDSTQHTLRSSKIGEERKKVLASALRIARGKAEILAKEGGAKLGALLNATEESSQQNRHGSFFNYNQRMASNSLQIVSIDNSPENSGNTDTDAVARGEHVISINVRVNATFELK